MALRAIIGDIRVSGGIKGSEYAYYPGQTGLPFIVKPGDRVTITKAAIQYQGPAQSLYLCWGIVRKYGVSFSNGGNLLGHNGAGDPTYFSAALLPFPESYSLTALDFTLNAVLIMPTGMPVDDYSTYCWISSQNSSSEAATIFKMHLPVEGPVLRVMALVPQVGTIEVLYVKL